MSKKLEVTMGWFDVNESVTRTVALVYLTPEVLFGIIQGRYEVDPKIFPDDVQLRHVEWDGVSQSFKILLESSKYYKTSEGNSPVVMSLRVRHKMRRKE